jgi:hypothetical protein
MRLVFLLFGFMVISGAAQAQEKAGEYAGTEAHGSVQVDDAESESTVYSADLKVDRFRLELVEGDAPVYPARADIAAEQEGDMK